MWGAEEEASRSIREGFPVEVAYKPRLEGGAGSGWVKVKAGGSERAPRAEDRHCQGSETREGWDALGRSGAPRAPAALCAFLTAQGSGIPMSPLPRPLQEPGLWPFSLGAD